MVLQHAHPLFNAQHVELDASRIVAVSGALVLNIAVLLVLLMPASIPRLSPHDDVITVVAIPQRIEPPPPPQTVDVARPQSPTRRSVAPVRPTLPQARQATQETGALPAQQVSKPPTDTASIEPVGDTAPLPGVRLEYADAPSPPYPRDALRAGLQGTVLLQVLVDVDGRPLQVEIRGSSGHRALDEAARRFVLKRWRFRPAMRDGSAVQAIGIVPIDFNLQR